MRLAWGCARIILRDSISPRRPWLGSNRELVALGRPWHAPRPRRSQDYPGTTPLSAQLGPIPGQASRVRSPVSTE